MKVKKTYILWIVAFFLGLYMLRNSGFTTEGDDEVYRTSIATWGSWYNWAKAYYYGNSGRVLIHTLLIGFLNMPIIVWKIASAGMIACTCCMLYRYTNVTTSERSSFAEVLLVIVPASFYFFIPSPILGNSVRWASGCLNYLFPICAMLVCLFPFWTVFMGKHLCRKDKVLALFFVCLCANMEQSSAVLSAMGILTFLYFLWGAGKTFLKDHKKDIIFLAVIWSINTLIALIGYLAPGNSSRYTEELLRFAGYNMYTMIEKMILGVQLFVLYFYSFRGLMMWLIPSGIIFLLCVWKKNYKKAIFPIVNVFLSCLQNILMRKVFNLEFVHPFNFPYAIWLAFSVMLLFFNGYIILQCTKIRQNKFWLLFTYYGLVTAGVIVSLSPTLYVSAGRTMYISYIMLLLIIGFMIGFGTAEDEPRRDDRFAWEKVNCIFGITASVLLVLLFVCGQYKVDVQNVSEYRISSELVIENVVVDQQNCQIAATVNVEPFEYTANNWCSGQIHGHDINLSLGIMDTDEGNIRIYRTYIHPEYPVMNQYPDNQLSFTGYYKRNGELTSGEVFVIIYTDHEGNKWYTPFETE